MMKKAFSLILIFSIFIGSLVAQSDDFFIPSNVDFGAETEKSNNSDDDLFGGSSSSEDDELFGGIEDLSSDDELFGSEDDLFSDDGIEEIDTSAKSDLSKGVLFEAGSIKIGGNFKTGINTNTILYNPKESNFGENLKNTTFNPNLSAYLTLDARPTETLRLYTKFGLGYPFQSKISLNLSPEETKKIIKLGEIVDSLEKGDISSLFPKPKPDSGTGNGAGAGDGTGNKPSIGDIIDGIINSGKKPDNTTPEAEKPKEPDASTQKKLSELSEKISIKDWLSLKELFTDFSINDTAFFRFGIHTVSWGAGYFFSPVSDIINTSSIDPENPTEQVNGSLNLRTQIIFPNTQNCLWFYVIPSTNFTNYSTAESYFRDIAVAGKFDFVLGDWELGTAAYWRYENAPKFALTTSGSIKKLGLFGELVYQYGGNQEWNTNKNWEGKTHIFHGTIGGFYNWSKPGIMLALQYYFDGNNVDFINRISTNGHNIALMANFSKFGSLDKLSASIFGIVNIGKKGLTDEEKESFGNIMPALPCLMINANIGYAVTDDIRLSLGPSILFTDFNEKPVVSLKFGATLGGGKF